MSYESSYVLVLASLGLNKLENVEHCGGEPEQADTGISRH